MYKWYIRKCLHSPICIHTSISREKQAAKLVFMQHTTAKGTVCPSVRAKDKTQSGRSELGWNVNLWQSIVTEPAAYTEMDGLVISLNPQYGLEN